MEVARRMANNHEAQRKNERSLETNALFNSWRDNSAEGKAQRSN
jgi:hypothetical protein